MSESNTLSILQHLWPLKKANLHGKMVRMQDHVSNGNLNYPIFGLPAWQTRVCIASLEMDVLYETASKEGGCRENGEGKAPAGGYEDG